MKGVFKQISDRHYRRKAIESEVMDALRPQFHTSFDPESQLKGDLVLADNLRKWAKQNTDGYTRRSYNKWINYYEGNSKEALRELAKRNKVASAARTVSVPKPN